MSVDVFLLINLLALFHRNTALPTRIPSPGRAPRPSCVIPEPRLPKLHSCFPTDLDSNCLPSSVLTAPLGLIYSAVVPKGALSIRDQPQPPNPLVSTLGSNWRGAQARWLNVHGQFSSVLTGTAPLGLMYSAVVPKGVFSTRDTPQPPKSRVSTFGSNCGAVLKLTGSIPFNKLMPLVRLQCCQWSSTPMFLLVSILTETYPLVTNPFSTRWSPPAVLSGVVLKLSGSISVVVGSC